MTETCQNNNKLRRPHFAAPKILALLTWIWLAVALPCLSDVARSFHTWLLLGSSWLILAVACIILPLFLHGFLEDRSGRVWWLSAVVPVAVGLTLWFTDIGLSLRFALSKSSLDDYVANANREEMKFFQGSRRVGLFLVDGVEEYESAVFLYTSNGFLNRYGIAYVPSGINPPPRRFLIKNLSGHWYSFGWRF